MRKFSLIVGQAFLACAIAGAQSQSAPADKSGYTAPRNPYGQPDLSGFWDIPYVPNMAMGNESSVPYRPAGADAYREHDAKDDPTGLCLPPGVPRIMQSPFPMAIVQTPTYVAMLFEYQRIFRLIYIDGREHHKAAGPTFMGDSIGHWEGETLVIETTDLNDRTWLDTAGHQHTADMRVIEKLRRIAPDKIDFEYTVDDPVYYMKPWVNHRTLTAQKPVKNLPNLIEYACEENNRDVDHLVPTKPGSKQ